ncbi:MAG: SufE family protein [Pseudomonadota bacterium]
MSIETIISDFEFLDDWEDKYRYVIELGREMERLQPEERTEAARVRGCASQVWLVPSELPAEDGSGTHLNFRGESDALIVQGLIAILLSIYNGKTTSEILSADALATFNQLGLSEHLTPQRSNGLKSMIERIRHEATAKAAS